MVVVRSIVVALVIVSTSPSVAGMMAEEIADRPHAATIRESLRSLEEGEEADDDEVKMRWYRRGLELAEEVVARTPNDPDAQFARFANAGRIYQTEGWLKNAFRLNALRADLDRILAIDPNHSNALASKGGLYYRLPRFLGGDVDKAEPLLRRAIELDPDCVGPRLELAELYIDKGQPQMARPLVVEGLHWAEEQHRKRFIPRAKKLLDELGMSVEEARAARNGPRRDGDS